MAAGSCLLRLCWLCHGLINTCHSFWSRFLCHSSQQPSHQPFCADRLCGPRRLFLVFGCKGDTDKEYRAEMGRVAHVKSDLVIITNDCPRYDAPEDIVADVVEGFPEEIRERYALWVCSPWQDPARTPWWFEEWLYQAQRENRR